MIAPKAAVAVPFSVPRPVSVRATKSETAILDAVSTSIGRGKGGLDDKQLDAFERAVSELEALGGVDSPTASPLLLGRWRLLYTTRPGTASPIQRTFTAIDSFSVYQDIESDENQVRVNNVVDFGPSIGYLKVEAEGSTDTSPIPNFEPRKGRGLPFGILGVSMTQPPAKKDMRIDFAFDKAAFHFNFLPFSIPYPVPFRLLADERKGWLDVTYLSQNGTFRLSRGNKGTLFVLKREESLKDTLNAALKSRKDADIEAAVDQLLTRGQGKRNPAKNLLTIGKWRLKWTKQDKTANPLQRALADKVSNWQIVREDGTVENRVDLLPGVRVKALATSDTESSIRTGIDINQVVLEVGPFKIPLNVQTDGRGFIDWLYLDEDTRVTRGNKGSVFVHTRDE